MTSASRCNRKLLRRLTLIAVGMFGFGYLLSPLYATLCRVTGINRLRAGDSVAADVRPQISRTILMQFDSNLDEALPWVFRPTQAAARVHPGQLVRISYEARNESDRTIVGQAIASYAPEGAAVYVQKLQCFCFSTQTLGPHEVRQMPVVFMIDPKIPNGVPTVTLSYTFFAIGDAADRGGRGT